MSHGVSSGHTSQSAGVLMDFPCSNIGQTRDPAGCSRGKSRWRVYMYLFVFRIQIVSACWLQPTTVTFIAFSGSEFDVGGLMYPCSWRFVLSVICVCWRTDKHTLALGSTCSNLREWLFLWWGSVLLSEGGGRCGRWSFNYVRHWCRVLSLLPIRIQNLKTQFFGMMSILLN